MSCVSFFASTCTAVTLVAVSTSARANPHDDRRQIIADTIEALRTMDIERRNQTHRHVYSVERNRCQAPLTSLKVGCLLEAAQRHCRKYKGSAEGRCRLVVDTMVTNRFSEPIFLSRAKRLRIMQTSSNYRHTLLGELRQRYARLATGLYLQQPLFTTSTSLELGKAIDAYCQTVAGRQGRLTWSHCTAALIWFIGTIPPKENPS